MIDILLVEDHRELAQLIVSFLKRDGFQAVSYTHLVVNRNGKEIEKTVILE